MWKSIWLPWSMTLVLIIGCDGRDGRAFINPDAWYRPPMPDLLNSRNLTDLEQSDFAVVAEGKQAEAQALLAEVPWQKLSQQDAQKLLTKPLDGSAVGHMVLLRAVMLGTGRFRVSWLD